MNTGKAVIAFIHPGTVAGAFTESLLLLLQHDHSHKRRVLNGGDTMSMNSGPRIASARNQIAGAFMAHPDKPEWLVMVDSDMTFAPDLVDRLVETATKQQLDVLGGLCFGGGRGGQIFPTLYRMIEADEEGRTVEIIEDYPEDALVKVDATGCACLMVSRKALSTVLAQFGTMQTKNGAKPNPSPWFAESVYAGREFGEDWTFCMRLQQCGFPIHVHTGIKLGHIKSHLLDEHTFSQFRADRARLGSSEAVGNEYRVRMFG